MARQSARKGATASGQFNGAKKDAMKLIKRVLSTLLLLIVLAAVAYARGLSGNDDGAATATAPPAATQRAGTGSSSSTTTGVIGLLVEPDDGRGPITDELASARSSIDVMVYLLSDRAIIQSLLDAEARGVHVRVILERNPYGGYGNPADIAKELRAGGVEVRWSSASFTYTHAKTIIVDRAQALILTLNLTRSAFESNREFGIVTTRSDDVASAQAIFDADWNDQVAENAGDLVVSPLNSRDELLTLIRSAKKTIEIYAEVVRDKEIVGQLKSEAKQGVAIRVIVSPDTDPSDLAVLDDLATAGVEIRLVASPYIHAKVVIVDGARAFVGSENFTMTSLDKNREIGLVTDDQAVIARLTSVFEGDYAKSKAYQHASD